MTFLNTDRTKESYFETIDISTYNKLFITDAKIKVWTYNNGIKDSVLLTQLPSLLPPYDLLPPIFTDPN